jgi:hypothetical protein
MTAETQESVQEVLQTIRQMRNEEDDRVMKWLDRADQYTEQMKNA